MKYLILVVLLLFVVGCSVEENDINSFQNDSINMSQETPKENQSDDLKFISVWNTSIEGDSQNNQIMLPLKQNGNYDFTVESKYLKNSPKHINSHNDNLLEFSKEGVNEINITGTIEGFGFGRTSEFYDITSNDRGKLLGIKQWGPLVLGDSNSYFLHAINLNISANDSLDLSKTTSLAQMFRMPQNNSFTISGSINSWDTSNIENMQWMFGRTSFNGELSNWDTSSVTDMRWMFSDANEFNQDISNWDTSNVESMREMFRFANSFNQDIGNWDTSSLTNIREMFRESQFNQDISNWDTSNIKTMRRTFDSSDFNQDISNWDTSNVENMIGMFQHSAFNHSIECWDVSLIEEEPAVFARNTSLTTNKLPKWGSQGC